MNEYIDDIKKELEEVRKLKEELKKEVEDLKALKRKEQIKGERPHLHREETRRHRAEARRARTTRPPRPDKPPKAPRAPRLARVDLDLDGLTDSLETMMDGLGHQIEMSLKNVEGLKIPGIRILKGRRRTKKREEHRAMIESIAPERVAKIVAPLGSEERLKLLDFLKTGGKSFNDIENHTGKTGSSLTHHLNPLIEAGYVVKGEVRGTYYVTVEGRLAYRLAQWLTQRVERQRKQPGNNSDVEVAVEFADELDAESSVEDETAIEEAEEHLEKLAEELEETRDDIEEHREVLEEAREELEEARTEELEDQDDDTDDLDELDWKD